MYSNNDLRTSMVYIYPSHFHLVVLFFIFFLITSHILLFSWFIFFFPLKRFLHKKYWDKFDHFFNNFLYNTERKIW